MEKVVELRVVAGDRRENTRWGNLSEALIEGRAGGLTLKNPHAAAENNPFKVEVFKKSLSFAHLSEEHLSALAKNAAVRFFPKKTFIFHEGDPADHLCIVQYGRVKLSKASPSGKEFVPHIAGPGNTLNVAALFGEKPHFSQHNALKIPAFCMSERKSSYLS